MNRFIRTDSQSPRDFNSSFKGRSLSIGPGSTVSSSLPRSWIRRDLSIPGLSPCRSMSVDAKLQDDHHGPISMHSQIYTPSTAASREKKAIILLHGYFGMHSHWKDFPQELATRIGTVVHTPDLRNHGKSPWGLRMTHDDFSADLERYIKEHQLDQAFVVGHSVGGSAVMHGCLCPNSGLSSMISGLFMVDIGPKPIPRIPKIDTYFHLCRLVREYKPKSFKDADDFLAHYVDVSASRDDRE